MCESTQAGVVPAMPRHDGYALAQFDDDSICILYEQVRHIAGRLRKTGFYSDSLSPTDLAHEALAKILGGSSAEPFASERHFLNLASLAMYQLLVDRLRRRQLRGPALEEIARKTVGLWENATAETEQLLIFANLLESLAARRPLAAEVVRYRFFFRMTLAEIAEKIGVSKSSLQRELAFAQAFLTRPGHLSIPAPATAHHG